ncbi:hypothetical protein AAU60_15000 [Acinetobacter johnsonii]|nr:hypothetical protein DT536_05600 [Acinetobacter johnsonii]KUG37475.1 hypothetical protein AAU60_15000 [Acinetobacter johnsonii]
MSNFSYKVKDDQPLLPTQRPANTDYNLPLLANVYIETQTIESLKGVFGFDWRGQNIIVIFFSLMKKFKLHV